jgi:hypothetical protein
VFVRRFAILAVQLFGACQGSAPAAVAPPVLVEARDGSGIVTAQLRPGHPCRASIGPVELIVGGPPLVAQDGAVRWTGDDRGNGTTLLREGEVVARVVSVQGVLSVVDPTGVALIRIGADAVSDASGRRLRSISAKPGAIAIDQLSVTGTRDAALAALLTAEELRPEVRMLAACERVLK